MLNDDFASLAARADLCRLLAACYYEPAVEFAEERLFDSLAAAAGAIDAALAQQAAQLGAAFLATDLQELLVDYTRLLQGPVGAPAKPYGSVWLDAGEGLMRDSTLAALALYREGGFEVADDFRDLPDHVAAELEFLYLLLFRQAEALRQGNAAAGAEAAALRRRFVAEHLGAWAPPFTAALGAHAQTDFYRVLAELTAHAVALEAGA
jgi:TorA maturation chaperone TorD